MAANGFTLAFEKRNGNFPPAYGPVRRDIIKVAALMEQEIRSADAAIAPVMRHIAGSRGGMLRPAMLLLCGKCAGGTSSVHHQLGVLVEIMHTATLLHDDVIDQAGLRRGRPSVNSLWGNDSAVLAGDYLLARTLHASAMLDDARLSCILADAAKTMCRGELKQDLLRGRWDITESTYRSIIKEKTAAFFSACCSLGAVASKASPREVKSMAAFGLELGIAFQHIDDLLDIIGQGEKTKKSNGSDLANAKMTLAFIKMLSALDARSRKAAIGKLKSPHPNIAQFKAQLRQTGALRHVYKVASKHVDRAIGCLESVPDSIARASLIAIAHSVTAKIDPATLS